MSEIRRQRIRLAIDLPSRLIGVTLTCLLFAFALPPGLVGLIYLICIGSEYVHARLTRRYLAQPTPGSYRTLLVFSGLGMTAFCLLPLLARFDPRPMVQFAGVLALTGALLNVAMMRGSHLALGIVNGLPPALALLWYPLKSLSDPLTASYAPYVLSGTTVLLGYFLSALIRNHRQDVALAEALDLANESSRAKSRFLSAMSHEMRTPLNAILGLSQLMRESSDPRQVRQFGRGIEQSGRALQALVEDVLELAAATESSIVVRPVTTTLRTDLETALNAAGVMHGGGRGVVAYIGPEVPELARLDPIILRRIVVGLAGLVCALSAPDANAPLRLECGCAGPVGRLLRIRLGCGPDHGRDRALPAEAPSQDSAALSSQGLAEIAPEAAPHDLSDSLAMELVQRLADAMGGSLHIEGTGARTVAQFDLPVTPVPEPPAPGAAATGLRALVVDDIATNRFVVVQLLRSLGIAAVEAESGQAALDRLATGGFDAVLLDMAMPGMDGEATFRAIRGSDSDWRGVPVIALTADALAERRDSYLALGLNGYVAKPVDRRILWSEIQGAITATAP